MGAAGSGAVEDETSSKAEIAASNPDPGDQIAGLIFAVILVDAEGRIAEANQSAENMLGKSERRLIGEPIVKVLGISDARVLNRLEDTEAALVARDLAIVVYGKEVSVNLTVSPLPNHKGWRVVAMSELGHEDTAYEDNTDTSIAAPSILAHEIKNPLAAIRGAGQLVARKLAHKDKPLARMITDEVDRIARLIDRMQQLGSSQSDPPAPCNLHEAVRSALAITKASGSVPVEISEEFDPSLPPVFANRDALEQVLINLISNARDAAIANHHDGDPARVIVQTRFVSGLAFSAMRLGRAVRLPIEITVSDNGAGIDPSMRDHVFEPFVSSKQSGQGLGLALVRKLVRDMNGSISHERDARAGLTHFRLHLPQAPRKG
ncbi:nitrogen regulation protein NR(II) [Erythrobacter sp. YT30]|uniref:two-component system sensor histidine kinase NtrB n=1 Tax=Erythrobacter sp. YT30 TaxID=1735012 RepID=UPI0009E9D1DA|nr:ATP-binding protein [Erythrobacter sp. YT30]